MIVYRTTDRIPVKMGEVTIWVSPFSYEQKVKLSQATKLVSGEEVMDAGKVALLSLKFSVKEVEGLVDTDGQPYELSFDADGTLTEECVGDLMQLDNSGSLAAICYKLSLQIKDHEAPGVVVKTSETRKSKKKPTV